MFLAGFGVALTVVPVGYSLLVEHDAGSFEHYVGEAVTAVALIALAVTAVLAPAGSPLLAPRTGVGTQASTI